MIYCFRSKTGGVNIIRVPLECLVMVERVQPHKYSDDDGRRQRAWITDGEERGRSSCERVMRVLSSKSWVGDIVETVRNGDDDRSGVDIYFEIDRKLGTAIGIWGEGLVIPIQVKSSEHEQRKFGIAHHHELFNLKRNIHLFVLDGQDAIDVISADLVGQMLVLSCMGGEFCEESFLEFLKVEMGDTVSVERYRENRELIVEEKWYGKRIKRGLKGIK